MGIGADQEAQPSKLCITKDQSYVEYSDGREETLQALVWRLIAEANEKAKKEPISD